MLAKVCDNVFILPMCRCVGALLCPDIPPVGAGAAVQRPLRPPPPRAVLVRGLRGLSRSHSDPRRVPLHHPLPSFQPLAEMLATQKQRHLALECYQMLTVFSTVCLVRDVMLGLNPAYEHKSAVS